MAVYKGTIAGIGDKNLGANIIKPEFDAKIYKFIIGKNCIIYGLDLNGNVLSAGMCVAGGYRGELKSPLTLDTTAFVYGVFKVNFDSNTLDEFYIETSTTQITQKDDILHTAGTYYLLLYKNGVLQLSRNYPANAVYADNTNHINDNGTLGKNVTCPTQAINDNSTKVANTEYVHNQIEKEIGYKPIEQTFTKTDTFTAILGQTATITTTITVTGKRKAKLSVFDNIQLKFVGSGNRDVSHQFSAGTVFATLPEDFKPKKESVVLIQRARINSDYEAVEFRINKNGQIYNNNVFAPSIVSGSAITTTVNCYDVGYETN